jgi:signal transduction histidine kinase
MTDELQFEASANLQRLIGRELIPTEDMAIVELVKNAYDSTATEVTITLQPAAAKVPGYIEIRDDGSGMTRAGLERNFMWAGYSPRPAQVAKAARVPTGEKGIGRFASDRLGSDLVVQTRTKSSADALELHIDWTRFADARKRFSEVTAPIKTIHAPELAPSGTVLKITHLHIQWDASRILALRSYLGELLDPLNPPEDFTINLEVPGAPKLSGPVTQGVPSDADLIVDFRILQSGEIRRSVVEKANPTETEPERKPGKGATDKLRGLTGRFIYFYKRPSVRVSHGMAAGVRLFRDGFRIEPFGSPTDDWLGISEKRAKRAGHAHIVPTRLFGFVEIHRKENSEIVDTTSRQALLKSDAASALVSFLRAQVDFLETLIRTKTTEPRWRENKQRRAVEFEQARLHTLGVMSFGLAHELRQPLQSIRSEANNINVRLRQLGIRDEDISSAYEAIDRGVDRIDKNISFIAELSRGDPEEITTFDLAEVVRGEVEAAFGPMCNAAGIKLEVSAKPGQSARLNKFSVSTVVVNLVKNAIDALEDRAPGATDGRIWVRVRKWRKQHVIEVEDNGEGVPAEVRGHLFKKFASKKTGGMGVGLYLCKTIVEARGGRVDYQSKPGETIFSVTLPDKED